MPDLSIIEPEFSLRLSPSLINIIGCTEIF
jgi:hypothetical protein